VKEEAATAKTELVSAKEEAARALASANEQGVRVLASETALASANAEAASAKMEADTAKAEVATAKAEVATAKENLASASEELAAVQQSATESLLSSGDATSANVLQTEINTLHKQKLDLESKMHQEKEKLDQKTALVEQLEAKQATDNKQFNSRPSLVHSVTVVLLSLVTGGRGVEGRLAKPGAGLIQPLCRRDGHGRPGCQGGKPEKPGAPPAGGRRGQVELLAHAYATCDVMSGLDKGP
jgi:chromosome segregation ATPase